MAFCLKTRSVSFEDFRYTIEYPKKRARDSSKLITSTLAINVDPHGATGRKEPRYSVVIIQRQLKEVKLSCVVWEGTNDYQATCALVDVRNSLGPFLENSIELNKELLEEAVIPCPLLPNELCLHLVDAIELRTNIHFRWHSIMHALLQAPQDKLLYAYNDEEIRKILEKLKSEPVEIKKCANNNNNVITDKEESPFHRNKSPIDPHRMSLRRSRLLSTYSCEYFSALGSPILDDFGIDDMGNTPLMIAVSKGYMKSCLYLLLGGSDPNAPHPSTGDTCLHMAIEHEYIDVVKLLLIFNADPLVVNHNNEKPLDKVPLASLGEYETFIKEVTALKEASKPPLIPEPVPTIPENSTFLLSLDGGGVRSLNLVFLMTAIEQRMIELDPGSKPLLSCFDYIAGSSAGSFIPLICLYGKINLQEYFALLFTSMIQIFPNSKDNGKSVENLLKAGVGEDTVLSDLESPRIMVTTTLADSIPCMLHLMKNYGGARDGQKGPNERKVWEAGRMSSAAPVHFEPFEGKFIDGSIVANNPTLTAMAEIIKDGRKLKFVLSLGTGKSPPTPIDTINMASCFSISGLLKIKNNISSAMNMLSLVIHQLAKADGHEVTKAESFCEILDATYHRLTPQLSETLDILESDIYHIVNMLYDCYRFILTHVAEIDKIARFLLQNSTFKNK